MATASGLKKDDYLDLCYLSSGQIELAQIASVSKISIPTEVVEHFKRAIFHIFFVSNNVLKLNFLFFLMHRYKVSLQDGFIC